VLGGGRSSIGGARSAECSITLFTRSYTPRIQDGSQKAIHARRFFAMMNGRLLRTMLNAANAVSCLL
jgi:hypothetical protein